MALIQNDISMTKFIYIILYFIVLLSCQKKEDTSFGKSTVQVENVPEVKINSRFTLMPPETTGVTFSNMSTGFREDSNYNIFRYSYMYNGGGVAAGDVNGDGLPDLYFTANFGLDKLYLNLGNFKFLDVTEKAGVLANIGFKTGTLMADINGDGKLDIYVCRTSKTDNGQRTNHVFINMGTKMENGIAIPVFEDQSKKLGLDDNSNSNHACFIDYDHDGDLDLFLLNHRNDFGEVTHIKLEQRPDGSSTRKIYTPSKFDSNKFYKNNNGHFTEVTREAGLEASAFGLSVTGADLNGDGWMDLFIANDYIEPDHVYINNRNGTFTDRYFESFKHSSQNSMGSDVADINNDGLDDIMVVDMKSEDPLRYKELANFMQYDRYNSLVQYNYGRQVVRNVLQLNNGNGTFSEIGQFAGVATTDWSWSNLIADYNNDGWKDIYVSNGIRRDFINYDYINFTLDSINRDPNANHDINALLSLLPEHKIQNYLFINNKKLAFINATKQAGMEKPSYSNGAAYADLDRDGDLDLIVNNIEDPAFIYRNDITGPHWLQIDVQDKDGNTDGIGTIVDVYTGPNHQHEVMITNKGFFSSSEPILQFGLDSITNIDSIILQWPKGLKEIMKSIPVDQRLVWKPGSGTPYKGYLKPKPALLFDTGTQIPGWIYQENLFVDFKREKLLPYMLSSEGPCMAIGDVNGDKLDDIYVGNGSGYPKALFLQTSKNTFIESSNPAFVLDSVYEDCGSVLADFDGDSDLDLIVVSGGNAFYPNDLKYMTRYYLNDGKGNFTRKLEFPIIRTNAGAVLAIDYDRDNDLDLIIAGRSMPGRFPEFPRSYLLRNDSGKFNDVTHDIFPDLENIGMITDIKSGDLDGDQNPEIVFVGEWLPITVYSYDKTKFQNKTSTFGLDKTSGWWKSVKLEDMDSDGDLDLFAGNIGTNSRLTTSEQNPITLLSKDFDGNGSLDPIMCFYYKGKLYPYAGRDEMIAQLPAMKKKYLRYTPYASASINDIFSPEELKGTTTLTTNTFQTMYLVNENKKFAPHALPYQVQLSPVFDMVVEDFNQDGKKDVLMAGNFLYSATETSEMDAGNGTLLLQNQDGTFRYVPNIEHGFWAQGEVREMKIITRADGKREVVTVNNKGPVQLHTLIHSSDEVR